MKYLDNLSKRLNRNQKIIVSIVVPLILFVITMGIGSTYSSSEFSTVAGFWAFCFAINSYFEFKMWGNESSK